jgi:hypothetical protein
MAVKRKWVVRVVLFTGHLQDDRLIQSPWITEHLRRLGYVTVHRDDEKGLCFDFLCPNKVYDTKAWAEMNANRMRSFGENAVAAPEWLVGDVEPKGMV